MDNLYLLPSNLGSGSIERREREQAAPFEGKRFILDVARSYELGNRTMILASGSDGRGQKSRREGRLYSAAGESIASQLVDFGVSSPGDIDVVTEAGKSDLRIAIQDRAYKNIVTIGHGCYAGWVSTHNGLMSWRDAAIMVQDHLKTGMFANISCGGMDSFNYIPFARYVMSASGVLIGKRKQYAFRSEIGDITNFEVLPNKP